MGWSKLDQEKKLCREWLQEPLVNPETGRTIERNGPTFNNWKKRCKAVGLGARPTATKTMSWSKCQEWRKNPTINPDTGRKIQVGGPKYQWIEKQCQLITEPDCKLQGNYFRPDKKGMVPCVNCKGVYYVVRKTEYNQVWGPLNKPTRNIKLHFYTHTWDYQHGHYRPVFIGYKPKPPRQATQPILKQRPVRHTPAKKNPKYAVDGVLKLFF